MLAGIGIKSDMAENGQAALDMFRESPTGTYDAVITDIHMPMMGGLELAEAIRGLNRPDSRIPIIAVTSSNTENDRTRSLNAGIDVQLTKPVDPNSVISALEKLI